MTAPVGIDRPLGLRPWLEAVDATGELLRIDGAHWDKEIGGLTEIVSAQHQEPPAILFDGIPGFPPGYRVATNLIDTCTRLGITMGLGDELNPMEFVQALRHRQGPLVGIPPNEVEFTNLFPNVDVGNDIDLEKFPVPRWHEGDGGRYIGTACMVITNEPGSRDWATANAGTYRVMLHGRDSMASFISPGKGGKRHREQFFDRRENCPVVVVVGQDPLLFVSASSDVPLGMTEFEYAGGLLGRPVDVVRGPTTGLPIPADAEIAIEGEILFDQAACEGPFGEWTGYYASGVREEPVIRVTSVMYKNDPIICGAPPMPPSAGKGNFRNSLIRSANIWNTLEAAGVPGVTGVWMPTAAGRFMTVVAIDQQYPGHAKQAAAVAGQCRAGAYLGRYVVVVDSDIDILNFDEVLWAICTRTDPAESIDFLRNAWSGPLDPIIPKEHQGQSSRALIDATRPYAWRSEFPKVNGLSDSLREALREKWPWLGPLQPARRVPLPSFDQPVQ